MPAFGAPFVVDRDGARRYGTLADFQTLVKIACVSPWLHQSSSTVVEPTDGPKAAMADQWYLKVLAA